MSNNGKTSFNISPVAKQIPFDGNGNGLVATDTQAAIDEVDNEVNIQNIIWVKKNPGHKDFSSIVTAINSITTASSTNQFLVKIAPGTYIEPQIIMKPFVSISGVEMQSVIIKPQNPADHLIIGAAASTIRQCTIRDVTGSGKAGIYSTASGLQIRGCVIRDNPINVLIEGISSLASVTADDLIITGVFTEGIRLKNSGAGVQGVFKGSIVNSIGTPSGSKAAVVDGSNVSFIFSSLVAAGINTANCLTVQNGATLKVLAAEIKGFQRAIWVENIGSGPILDLLAINLDSNVTDVQVDHPSASGAIQGIATRTKVINNAPNGVQITYQDPVTGDLNISRILATRGFSTDLTTIVASNTTTQIVSIDAHAYIVTGSTPGQILKLPDATTLRTGHQYWIINSSSVPLTIQSFDGSNSNTFGTGASIKYVLSDNSTQAGIWHKATSSSSTFQGTSPILAFYGGNASAGRYLEIFPGEASNTGPLFVPSSSVLIGFTINVPTLATTTIGIFKTSDLSTAIATLTLTNETKKSDTSLNVTLSPNDELAVQIISGSCNKPRITFYIAGV